MQTQKELLVQAIIKHPEETKMIVDEVGIRIALVTETDTAIPELIIPMD